MARNAAQAPTLIDRCALAFLSGAAAFLLGSVVWFAAFYFSANLSPEGFVPFAWVGLFACVMAVIGFLAMENLVARLIGWLAHKALELLRWASP